MDVGPERCLCAGRGNGEDAEDDEATKEDGGAQNSIRASHVAPVTERRARKERCFMPVKLIDVEDGERLAACVIQRSQITLSPEDFEDAHQLPAPRALDLAEV